MAFIVVATGIIIIVAGVYVALDLYEKHTGFGQRDPKNPEQ